MPPLTTVLPSEPGSLLATVTAFAHQVVTARPLTPRQLDAMRILTEWIDERGTAPTIEQLASEMDLVSKSAAHRLLCHLVAKGWIARDLNRARSIEILRRPPMPDFTTPEFVLSDDVASLR